MKNRVILKRSFFSGSASRRFETSMMMDELMKNPKVARALYDKTRQREFHDAVIEAMDGADELDTDALRVALLALYNSRNTHISKGAVKDIAMALLTENRDPSKEYFVTVNRDDAKNTNVELPQERTPDIGGDDSDGKSFSASEDSGNEDTSKPAIRKRTTFQRIFG